MPNIINQIWQALVRGAILFIPGVSLEDAGEYICTATNPQGSTTTRARVQISQEKSDKEYLFMKISI